MGGWAPGVGVGCCCCCESEQVVLVGWSCGEGGLGDRPDDQDRLVHCSEDQVEKRPLGTHSIRLSSRVRVARW